MKTAWKWIAGVVTGIVAALLLFGKRKPKKKVSGPPKSRTTKVVVEQINDDLEEGLDKVDSALEADDPAKELAKLGNSRSRS